MIKRAKREREKGYWGNETLRSFDLSIEIAESIGKKKNLDCILPIWRKKNFLGQISFVLFLPDAV